MRASYLPLLLILAACARAPEVPPLVGGPVPPDGYPVLEPLAPILARLNARGASPETDGAALLADARRLQARRPTLAGGPATSDLAALRARAAILRGDATDVDALRARLAALP